ncbi:MAG: Lrp/AsnC family transcriptional regulator [Thermoplasmata archaeon]|nr:MAG: Lrp/AsnC family transcriptional regulator [Thermoplasmata archaeon]
MVKEGRKPKKREAVKGKPKKNIQHSRAFPITSDAFNLQPIDEVDMKLLQIIQENGRMPNIEIAERMGMSEGTVRRRVNNLIERDLIRGFAALLNHKKLGSGLKTLVYAKVKKDDLENVVDIIELSGKACSIHQVMGKYNLSCDLLFKNILEVQEFVDTLSLSGQVEEIEYHIVTKSYKECPWTGI